MCHLIMVILTLGRQWTTARTNEHTQQLHDTTTTPSFSADG